MTPPPEFNPAAFAPTAAVELAALSPVHGQASAAPLSVGMPFSVSAMLADISRLTRPRIALMVLATVVAAMWLTAGRGVGGQAVLWLLVGTTLVAASSSIANQILERDADRLMPRTARRPIAAGRLSVPMATMLATLLVVAGAAIITLASGWQPALAAVATA
ncbi:MAG: UbiA family prenyltransferase [Planctomycetia bacterium]